MHPKVLKRNCQSCCHAVMLRQFSHLWLHGLSDVDWASFIDDRISTSGILVFYGLNPIMCHAKNNTLFQDNPLKVSTEF